MQDFRAHVALAAALEQAAFEAALRIALFFVGEGKACVRIAEEAVAQSVGAIGLGEAEVQVEARGGNVRVDALEDDAQVLGFIEALVHEIAQEAAALRSAVRDRHADLVPAVGAERIGAAKSILLLVAQEADPVARRRIADAGHGRILRAVGELVEDAGAERRAGGQQANGIAVDEFPSGRRNLHRRFVIAVACREPRARLVEAHGGKRELRHAGSGRVEQDFPRRRVVEEELVPHRLLDRRHAGHFEPQQLSAVCRHARQARNPAAPGDGEAVAHEEAVTRRVGRGERVAGRRVVQQVQHALVAAIVDVVEQRAVALGRIRRPQDVEVRRVFDLAARIARREPDVDDVPVRRMRRIEFAVKAPADTHVGPGGAEGLAAGVRRLGADFEAGYFGERRAGKQQ